MKMLGERVAPDPAALIESMRAFGYSLPTAIADLVDNSITAGARTVEVIFDWRGSESSIVVLDDGSGMDEKGLVEAMRLGSRSPAERRASGDLGRFGLGLKSAAWSQARVLTVLTKPVGGSVLRRTWDLDHVVASAEWDLLEEASGEDASYAAMLAARDSGTAVVLRRPDKLVGQVDAEDDVARERFFADVAAVEHHLAMVFHRFLAGRDALALSVNGIPVEGWDPFLEHHPATQQLPSEDLRIAGRSVGVTPFVLPHVSKLTPDEHSRAAGPSGWNGQQGFYVYRERRLLVAGSWLGLKRMQKEEHCKLARIRVDLDNTLDLLWQIDVRKASASIPAQLEADLRRIATVTRRRAAEAYRFRGKQIARASTADSGVTFVWELRARRGSATSFRINRKHPVLEALREEHPESRGAVERALRLVEENLPIESIVMDVRERPEEVRDRPFAGSGREVADMLRAALASAVDRGAKPEVALRAIAGIEPFDSHPEIIQQLAEELAA